MSKFKFLRLIGDKEKAGGTFLPSKHGTYTFSSPTDKPEELGGVRVPPGTENYQILMWDDTNEVPIWSGYTVDPQTPPDGYILIGVNGDYVAMDAFALFGSLLPMGTELGQILIWDPTLNAGAGAFRITDYNMPSTISPADVGKFLTVDALGNVVLTVINTADVEPGITDNDILKWDTTTMSWRPFGPPGPDQYLTSDGLGNLQYENKEDAGSRQVLIQQLDVSSQIVESPPIYFQDTYTILAVDLKYIDMYELYDQDTNILLSSSAVPNLPLVIPAGTYIRAVTVLTAGFNKGNINFFRG